MCLLYYCFFLMIRRPPRSTRTDTLFPYTTRFRSAGSSELARRTAQGLVLSCGMLCGSARSGGNLRRIPARDEVWRGGAGSFLPPHRGRVRYRLRARHRCISFAIARSEERRVGQESVSAYRLCWSPYHKNKKTATKQMPPHTQK